MPSKITEPTPYYLCYKRLTESSIECNQVFRYSRLTELCSQSKGFISFVKSANVVRKKHMRKMKKSMRTFGPGKPTFETKLALRRFPQFSKHVS